MPPGASRSSRASATPVGWSRATEPTLVELARDGVRRVDVLCPGFPADCLETLEEIGLRAQARYVAAGGETLGLIPCLNNAPEWIAALAEISGRAGP